MMHGVGLLWYHHGMYIPFLRNNIFYIVFFPVQYASDTGLRRLDERRARMAPAGLRRERACGRLQGAQSFGRPPRAARARHEKGGGRPIPRRIHRALGHGGARTSQKAAPRRHPAAAPPRPKRNHAARRPLVSIGPARHARRREDHRRLIDRRLAEGQNVARLQVVDAPFRPFVPPAGSAPSVLRLPS
jgi:hypothetical protein